MTLATLTTRARVLFASPSDLTTAEGRARERYRRAAMTAGASAVGKLVSVSTSLISVPLALHYLGQERYGMWMTISSLVVVLSFADFGVGNGLFNVVADAHGRDDRVAMRQAISSGFAVLGAIAVLVAALFAVVYPITPWFRLFNVASPLARGEAGPAMAVFLGCFALALPLGVAGRVQSALQRGFLGGVWGCVGSVAALAGVLTAIHLKAGLPWLVFAFMGIPLLVTAVNSMVFFGWLERDIRPDLRLATRSFAVQVARTGALFFVLQIVVSVAYSSDNIIIAQILGARAVPQYAVPEKMFNLIPMVLGMALAPLWPAYREALARGDRAWLRQTLLWSLGMALACAAPISLGLVAFGPWLLHLWVGPTIHPTWFLLVGLGLWKVMEAFGTAMAMFLNGVQFVRVQAIAAVAMAIVSITLEIMMVSTIGVAGAVWATIVAFGLCNVIPTSLAARNYLRQMKEGRNGA